MFCLSHWTSNSFSFIIRFFHVWMEQDFKKTCVPLNGVWSLFWNKSILRILTEIHSFWNYVDLTNWGKSILFKFHIEILLNNLDEYEIESALNKRISLSVRLLFNKRTYRWTNTFLMTWRSLIDRFASSKVVLRNKTDSVHEFFHFWWKI